MNFEHLLREFNELPLDAQQQVADFIAFLHQRYPSQTAPSTVAFADEPFIGMWDERSDMEDSSQWVRTIRKCEWK